MIDLEKYKLKERCEVCNEECVGNNVYSDYTLLESNWRCPKGHYFEEWAYGHGIQVFVLDGEELEIHNSYTDKEEVRERNKEEIENFVNSWYDRAKGPRCVK